MTFTRLPVAAALALGTLTAATLASAPAQASTCGWFAFAGAFQNYGNAQRQANRLGGGIWNVDNSDSPNAGRGFWAVGTYHAGSKRRARESRNYFRRNGVPSAYIGQRCFY